MLLEKGLVSYVLKREGFGWLVRNGEETQKLKVLRLFFPVGDEGFGFRV